MDKYLISRQNVANLEFAKMALRVKSPMEILKSWQVCLQRTCSHILVCNFISHFFQSGFQPSLILSHVSAINSYVHKLLNKPDPTQYSFIVRNLLQGAQKLGKSADSRLPITQPILHRLIEGLSNTVANFNDRIMLNSPD
jgi:hypothetical protein